MVDSNSFRPFDKATLLEVFEYLNERLKENRLYLEITIYGGSVMTMVYDNRPATRDIDCVFSKANSILLQNILDMTGYVFNLPKNWINDEVKEPLRQFLQEDKETFRVYSNLSILKPRAEQLLAMKVLAARPEPALDFLDAHLLCKELGITSKEHLLKVTSVYLPLTLLGDRQLAFIKYLGKDLGYDWE